MSPIPETLTVERDGPVVTVLKSTTTIQHRPGIPPASATQPSFREVAWAFYLRALQIYGVAASTDAREAFTEVGLPPTPQFPAPES